MASCPSIRLCCPNNHNTCHRPAHVFFLLFFIFVQVFGCCHETRARCSQPAANLAASHLAAVKPPWHCCLKGWARPLLATGVSGVCAAAKWDRLLDWLKTSLKNESPCKLTWVAARKWLAVLVQGRQRAYPAGKGKDATTPYSYADALLCLFCLWHHTRCIYHQPLSSWSCPSTAAALASIRFACVRAGWEKGRAETAALYGHTTTAVFSLHLYSLLFLSFFFIHASAALNTCYSCYSWLWCLALSGQKAVVSRLGKCKN